MHAYIHVQSVLEKWQSIANEREDESTGKNLQRIVAETKHAGSVGLETGRLNKFQLFRMTFIVCSFNLHIDL